MGGTLEANGGFGQGAPRGHGADDASGGQTRKKFELHHTEILKVEEHILEMGRRLVAGEEKTRGLETKITNIGRALGEAQSQLGKMEKSQQDLGKAMRERELRDHTPPQGDPVNDARYHALFAENKRLSDRLAELEKRLGTGPPLL